MFFFYHLINFIILIIFFYFFSLYILNNIFVIHKTFFPTEISNGGGSGPIHLQGQGAIGSMYGNGWYGAAWNGNDVSLFGIGSKTTFWP